MYLPKPLTEQEARLKNPLALAFMGDTVWDLLIRQQLLLSQAQVNTLHRRAVQCVNAGAQAEAASRIEAHLTEKEHAVFQRGCNAHARHNTPKNQDPYAYSRATGLEAVIGYLYLMGEHERIGELFDIASPLG